MYYNMAADMIKELLSREGIRMAESFTNTLLDTLSDFNTYFEEDCPVLPQIIIGLNLEKYFETITPRAFYKMGFDDFDGNNWPRFLKSLALCCNNGWYIVINIAENGVHYGIFRRYTDLDGERFEEYFRETFKDYFAKGCLIIKAVNATELVVYSSNGEEISISNRYIENEQKYQAFNNNIDELIDDIIKACEDKIYLKKCFKKMFRLLPTKIHGTIIVVVNETFDMNCECLAGIEIEPPIDFEVDFCQNKSIERYSEAEAIYSSMGLMYEMLNTDGITIINTKAKILAYNMFYEGIMPKFIKGGARKRTAFGLLENKTIKGIEGIYFQSQDGDTFYKRKENR